MSDGPGTERAPVDPDIDPDLDLVEDRSALRRLVSMPARRFPGEVRVLFAVAVGGVLGAVARYGVSVAMPARTHGFPWWTFLVNVTGSGVLGVLLALMIERFPRGRLARALLGTGVIGAYTTFSTVMVQAVQLVRGAAVATAAIYVAASLAAGLVAAWAGWSSTRALLRSGTGVGLLRR